jgi:membrane protein DedA with SNARE-associated domain/membrane-associated phospholipid phosphatase
MNIQPIIQFLHLHPHASGIITFTVVFLEALAVVGVIIPGTVTMTAIGALAGANIISIGNTFAWAIAGAIIGDFLSYLVGVHYQDRLHRIWPFKKHPLLLTKSEEFYAKHGGKSVFIGRFIGPMRAMGPLVAGMLKMPMGRFLVAAIPSVSLWAILYLLPGILLGALSLELPPKVATTFILWTLLAIASIWIITWLAQLFAKRIYRWLDSYVKKLWNSLQRHKSCQWFTKLLADPREPDNHLQLSLVILAFLAIALFFVLLHSMVTQGELTQYNLPLYTFFTNFHFPRLDHIFVAITLLGQEKVILLAATIFLVWLCGKRYWYIALHWLILIIVSVGSISAAKLLFFSPRPSITGVANFIHTSSFPSGHTVLSIAIFGFWAVLVARELKPTQRWFPYLCASSIASAVALSRLYLGAHWLTDVLGGIAIGVAILFLLTISYRRRHTVHFSLHQFVAVSLTTFIIIWFSYNILYLSDEINNYTIRWPIQNINLQDLRTQKITNLPLYRNNRVGTPIQALNLLWAEDLTKIRQVLLSKGWIEQSTEFNLHAVAQRLLGDGIVNHLPLLPQLYHSRSPVLIMTKPTDREDTILILNLWQSDIKLQDSKIPLWLGTIDYHRLMGHKLFYLYINKHDKTFAGATENLIESLPKDIPWQEINYPLEQQPREMQNLQWDGKAILIAPAL